VQKHLVFAMVTQQQSQWCWAAVAVSVAGFFGNNGWTQCSVVNAELGRGDCCNQQLPGSCNVVWLLDRALNRVGHFNPPVQGALLPVASVQTEINADRPIGCRIGWSGGGGHFVVLSGYDFGGASDFVDVQDPWYGPSVVNYSTFASSYQSNGSWTHSYLLV
jgi:hypothetical protein